MLSPTEIKGMTEGERTIYLITIMHSNCSALEKLIFNNSKEHNFILSSVAEVDKEIFTKIDELKKEKISNKLFYSTIGVIVAVLLAFSGTLYWSGKEVTKNAGSIKGIERKVFSTIVSKQINQPGM